MPAGCGFFTRARRKTRRVVAFAVRAAIMCGQIPQEMAKLTIKGAPAKPAPAPVKEAPGHTGWTYYVIPPLLIIGVFWYCSKHAHKAPAPAQPAVAAAPAEPAPAVQPQEEAAPAPAAAVEPAAPAPAPAATAEDEDFAGDDTAAPDEETPQEETEE